MRVDCVCCAYRERCSSFRRHLSGGCDPLLSHPALASASWGVGVAGPESADSRHLSLRLAWWPFTPGSRVASAQQLQGTFCPPSTVLAASLQTVGLPGPGQLQFPPLHPPGCVGVSSIPTDFQKRQLTGSYKRTRNFSTILLGRNPKR